VFPVTYELGFIASQKTAFFIVTAMKTSDLTKYFLFTRCNVLNVFLLLETPNNKLRNAYAMHYIT
jgi:hypothetical protein